MKDRSIVGMAVAATMGGAAALSWSLWVLHVFGLPY
ncbi:Na+/alanine symporter [Limibacillus sp. MBR-115]|jgi:Na+/alanine symporter|uniref:Na+/alanine symporter n=1 Tax=Limibacillus halophilus TaxID=1579333 RepID=A0A839SWW9_9PROT|nr:Na+/alanine symporter [Limibacillus halophilus]